MLAKSAGQRRSTQRNAWLRKRNRAFHVTVRDVDCRGFDVQRFIDDLASMHVSMFSFLVGGYVTTSPTVLRYQRVSPYLDGRDLTGEIIAAAHAAGIKVLGMIDLGQIPEEAARDHPDWCSQDEEGRPVVRVPGLYAACPMGGFQRTYVREIVAEILGRYDLDCVKFGGGSFGFSRSVCHCPNCRESFRDETGHALPLRQDWSDPVWRTYTAWRLDHARHRVEELGGIVHDIDPEMPFMGNSVCFGDPEWTVGASLDVESQAAVADAVQVEVQSRARYDEATGEASWQYLSWPAETARFMTSISDTPIWVVASYFLAWPWRRSAMAPVEQKVYLAQIAANGADPMVNLSGGPPAVHEDPRGFAPIRDLFGFLSGNQAYYEGDTSGANVAVVYSMETLFFYGQEQPEKRYVREIRGIEQALHEAHIPFDIISTRVLTDEVLSRYGVLVLPNVACLVEAEADAIRRFAERGGGIVVTHATSLYDAQGIQRESMLLGDLMGVSYTGETRSSMVSPEAGYKQTYMSIVEHHPILEGIVGTHVMPMGGDVCVVEAEGGTRAPLELSAPFIVFPEGFAYPRPTSDAGLARTQGGQASLGPADVTQTGDGTPFAVVRECPGGGRTVYFAGTVGSLFWTVRYPDHGRLIANAVRWAAREALPVIVKGPATLQVSLRSQLATSEHTKRYLVHLINLTGGERFFRELVPLRDVVVGLSRGADSIIGERVQRAYLLSDLAHLPVDVDDSGWWVTIPRIVDYDVLVFEMG